MGIKGFFAFFKSKIKNFILPIKLNQTIDVVKNYNNESIQIDVLTFEINPIIYNALYKVQEELKSQNKVSLLRPSKAKKISLDEFNNKVYNKTIEIIDSNVKMNNPKQMIYFVIDGVAGMSKQTQQRQRRFRNISQKDDEFDKNCITPGTDFLDGLSIKIKDYIKIKMKNEWKDLNVIYNDHKNVGEGEHKLIHFIRKLPIQLSISIISPDADLFLLALGLRRNNMYIFRPIDKNYEKVYFDYDYLFADLDILKKYILEEVGILPTINNKNENDLSKIKENINKPIIDVYNQNKYTIIEFDEQKNNAIEDFILYIMMIGNDFLPHIPHLHTRENIEDLFNSYKNVVSQYGFLTQRNSDNSDIIINSNSLKQLFIELSKFEESNIIKDFTKKNMVPYKLLKNNIKLTQTGSYILDLDNYKFDYYTNKLLFGKSFSFDKNSNQKDIIKNKDKNDIDKDRLTFDIKNLINEYIKGMLFVLKYYLYKIPTYNWFYPYHYAPLLSDLYKYFPEDINYKFNYAEPLTPIEQLLCVLPPTSNKLLPESLRFLMLSDDSPIKDMFPKYDEIQLDNDGAGFIYQNNEKTEKQDEVLFLLPFSDFYRVKEQFNILKDKLNDKDKKRNERGNLYKYTYDNVNKNIIEKLYNENDII